MLGLPRTPMSEVPWHPLLVYSRGLVLEVLKVRGAWCRFLR
jgi:hypothetical protein